MQGAIVFPKSCEIKRKIVFHMIIYLALMMMMMMMMMMNCFFEIVGCDWLDSTVLLDRSYNFTCVNSLVRQFRLFVCSYVCTFICTFIFRFFNHSFAHSLVKSFSQSGSLTFSVFCFLFCFVFFLFFLHEVRGLHMLKSDSLIFV